LVSFQANKSRAAYRWYKFKEAFSATLVEYLLTKYRVTRGSILDPFAGSGTALFVASEMGLSAEGIELLPIGSQIVLARNIIQNELTAYDIETLISWARECPWELANSCEPLLELRITKGAYPENTRRSIERFLAMTHRENERVKTVLRFALLCVLESVSYTRKDGQYLRWDDRSGRRQGSKPFHKGPIVDFNEAIREKIMEIVSDAQSVSSQESLFPRSQMRGEIKLQSGSCLEILPRLSQEQFDAIITSPPYCNRYDYTRTYALELALLGVDEPALSHLRQQMLSCTVENRAKDLVRMNPSWEPVLVVVDNQQLLQAILGYLEEQKTEGLLNNSGIPRMVRGYFYEMACVIAECARVLKPGAPFFMVNDNVRYAGVSISVDMILSDIAEQLGFRAENILVLPTEKGNSSQQMGEHGRKPLRKCIYVWRRI
jgi:DNA modification methylase